jgi:hypothetical protein
VTDLVGAARAFAVAAHGGQLYGRGEQARPGANRNQRKAATYERMRRDIAAAPAWIRSAVRAKVADRLANLRVCHRDNPSLLDMYRRESATFRSALFVAGVCDALWVEYDRLSAMD